MSTRLNVSQYTHTHMAILTHTYSTISNNDSGAETLEGPTNQLEVGRLEGLIEDDEIDQEKHLGGADGPDIDELGEALRVLENAVYVKKEPDRGAISTRANTNPERFRAEEEAADKYAEYVAMGWREPEVQDAGKVVFNKTHRRTEGNVIRAKEIFRNSYLSRHGGAVQNTEAANIYFDQAMKTKPTEAWHALLMEVLKKDSKRILQTYSTNDEKLYREVQPFGRLQKS